MCRMVLVQGAAVLQACYPDLRDVHAKFSAQSTVKMVLQQGSRIKWYFNSQMVLQQGSRQQQELQIY